MKPRKLTRNEQLVLVQYKGRRFRDELVNYKRWRAVRDLHVDRRTLIRATSNDTTTLQNATLKVSVSPAAVRRLSPGWGPANRVWESVQRGTPSLPPAPPRTLADWELPSDQESCDEHHLLDRCGWRGVRKRICKKDTVPILHPATYTLLLGPKQRGSGKRAYTKRKKRQRESTSNTKTLYSS